MCFEQKSTTDPKVLCRTGIKSKRNSSRLDMHRETKNCDLLLENVVNGQPFVSRSAATQTRQDRPFEQLQQHQTTPCTSSENIVIPSNGSSYQFKKTIVIGSKDSTELSIPKQSPTFPE